MNPIAKDEAQQIQPVEVARMLSMCRAKFLRPFGCIHFFSKAIRLHQHILEFTFWLDWIGKNWNTLSRVQCASDDGARPENFDVFSHN